MQSKNNTQKEVNKFLSADSKESLYTHLNIASITCHHKELHILLNSLKFQPKTFVNSESRIRKDRQRISNIRLQNCINEHIAREASTAGVLLYIERDCNCKTIKDLLRNKSKKVESILIEITNKNGKDYVVVSTYKHPTLSKQELLDDYTLPLLGKHSFERKKDNTFRRFQPELTKLQN